MIISLNNSKTAYIPVMEEMLGETIHEFCDRSETLKRLPEADIIVTFGGGQRSLPFDAEVLAACGNIKLVLSITAGMEDVPIEKLHEMGIKISSSRGAQGASIAEYVLACMLIMSHNYHFYFRNQMIRKWGPVTAGEDLAGKTLCVIGTGTIGTAVAQKAAANDMRIIGIDKYPQQLPVFDAVSGTDKLYEALAQSDYAVLAAPLTEETYHMMSEKEFSAMKETAVFINISRGGTADEAALINALQNRQIAGAVLDVFHEEPLAEDSPFWGMENVIVTPHASGPSKNTTQRVSRILCDNIMRFRSGEKITNEY